MEEGEFAEAREDLAALEKGIKKEKMQSLRLEPRSLDYKLNSKIQIMKKLALIPSMKPLFTQTTIMIFIKALLRKVREESLISTHAYPTKQPTQTHPLSPTQLC